ARAASTPIRTVCAAHVRAELRRNDHLAAARTQGLAEQNLRAACVAVDICGVEQRDAGIYRGVHHGRYVLVGHPGAEVITADADGGDGQAGQAKLLVDHFRGHVRPSGSLLLVWILCSWILRSSIGWCVAPDCGA